ncbi:hypothetical protein A1351_20220 [Methylosinus sp. R-45379]|nr:hypothetical protein A1351_20220 [Methylosinus sp. R-45379]
MKALTIWQPWCSLIIVGAKPYEFRSWEAPRSVVGQRIALHAGARKVKREEIANLILRLKGDNRWTTGLRPEIALPFLEKWHAHPGSLPLSCILGTALLGAPRRAGHIAHEFGGAFINDSERDEYANFAWPMLDLRVSNDLRPVKGAQGFFNCDYSEAA